MKHLLAIVACFASLALCGQNASLDCRIAESYINQDMKSWGKFVDEISAEIELSYSEEMQFKRAVVRHLYLAYLLFNDKDSKQIAEQLAGLKKDIEQLEKSQHYAKTVLALKSPYLAYSALNNPVTAVYRLPMSFSSAKNAIAEARNSAYSWAEYGNLQYCYALFIGGSFNDAISSFQKAIDIIEERGEATECNWYYINALLFLAKSYEDGKQLEKANRVYDKILALRPDYEAVKRWKH